MISLTGEEIAGIVEGRLTSGSQGWVTGWVIDSREAVPGVGFAALRGEFADGHDFVADAFKKGAVMALVERELPEPGGPFVVVADVLGALQALGAYNRDVVDPIVVGITGSTGKTSTRELVAAVLSEKFRCLAAERNFNNEIGLPLTLLRAVVGTEVLVCEMGAQRIGDIDELCRMARPQVGVVTNVGVTHLEYFGTRGAIAATKGELVRGLPEGGTAVLNADDVRVAEMALDTRANVITYGLNPGADVRAERVSIDRMGRPTFRLHYRGQTIVVELASSGRHQVSNSLASAAVGVSLGMSLEDCRRGLEKQPTLSWRMEVRESDGVVLVNDAYNANPDSMASALQTCADMVEGRGRLVVVLGYMAELGDLEAAAHDDLGRLVAETADRLVAVGEKGSLIAEGARSAGMAEAETVPDAAAAVKALDELRRGDVVLVKGSRVAGLEHVTQQAITLRSKQT